MKKFLTVCTVVLALFLASAINSSAVVHQITFEWDELGANPMGVSADAEDYFGDDYSGETVNGLRCSYSSWDQDPEYLWLITNWSNARHTPAWIYIGEHDMSELDIINFYYVTDGTADMTDNRVSLSKDKEGTEVVAFAQITEATAPLASPRDIDMEIIDEEYEGGLYLFIEHTARMFVGNLEFTTKDDGSTPVPTEEPTPTPDPTDTPAPTDEPTPTPKIDEGDDSNTIQFVIIGVIAVVAIATIIFIWKKKS